VHIILGAARKMLCPKAVKGLVVTLPKAKLFNALFRYATGS